MTVMLQSPFKGQNPGTLYTGPEEAALVASGSASLIGGTEATGRLQGSRTVAALSDPALSPSDNLALQGAIYAQRLASAPTGFAFDFDRYPITPSIITAGRGRRYGTASYDPFMSTPSQNNRNGQQVWMSPTGNDTTGDGSAGNPYAGLSKCQTVRNTNGGPGTVNFKPGAYTQANSQLTVTPTVDTTYLVSNGSIAGGGVAWLRSWVTQTWTADTTYVNLWKCTELSSSVSRVVEYSLPNIYGNPSEYIRVASLVLCSLMPGSYFSDGTGTWANPFPGRDTISNTSTHILRQRDIFNITLTAPVNLFWDTDGDANSFLMEGGQKGTHVVNGMAAAPGVKTIAAARGVKAICGGSNTYGNGAFYSNRWDGLVWYERCFGGASWEDGPFNSHCQGVASGDPFTSLVASNCSGNDAGRVRGAGETSGTNPTSCNFFTGHDANAANTGPAIGMVDIAGEYGPGARGQGIHLVGRAHGWLVGTRTGGSLGDIAASGTFHPAEIRVADDAKIWADAAEPQPIAAATWAYLATDNGQIKLRNTLPALGRVGATGSTAAIGTY